jgi:hypothetical protein
MKHIFFIAIIVFFSCSTHAQQKVTPLDKSPLDMVYCPPGYPGLNSSGKVSSPPVARVLYSRPQKKERVIFGELVKYGEIWRLGANEVTEIEFFKPVKINGTSIAKGRYSLYAIPYEQKWTFIINTQNDVWGMTYNKNKDVVRVDVPVQKTEEVAEPLTLYFETNTNGANLIVWWDTVKVALPIVY